MSDEDDAYAAGFDEGYVTAMAQIMAREAHTLPWRGAVHGDRTCEACGQTFPESEYGITLRDDLWSQIAPRPDAGYFGSGVVCLDCIEKALGREVEVEDVASLAQYGEHPTFRAAVLAVVPFIAFEEHLRWDDDEE